MIDAAEVRAQVSVPEALEALGLEPPPRVPGHVFCTAHEEDTPSLYVQEHRWWAFCCGVGGDVIDLVRFVGGASFGQAIQFLSSGMDFSSNVGRVARPERVVEDFTDRFAAEPACYEHTDHLMRRWPHLRIDFLEQWFRVKSTRHALWIPHWDGEGHMTGVKTRSLYTGDKKAFPGSTFPRLYRAVNSPPLTLTHLAEGESDTWTLASCYGPSMVCGLPSGVQGWRKYIDHLAAYEQVVCWFDNDRAGDAAAAELWAHMPDRVVRGEIPAEHNDVTEAVVAGWRPTAV